MQREDIIQMAREAGFESSEYGLNCTPGMYAYNMEIVERFAQLVEERTAAAEQDKWKEIVEGQRQRLQALNEIIGGEDSTTTGNILSYSRWEMRLEDAVAAEREACRSIAGEYAQLFNSHPCVYVADAIHARGKQ